MGNTKLLQKIYKWSTIICLSLALALLRLGILIDKMSWGLGRAILIFTILGSSALLAMGPNAYYKRRKILAWICYILLGLSALLLICCMFVGFSKGFVFAKITYIVVTAFVPYYTIVGVGAILDGRYKPAQIVYAIAISIESLYIDLLILGAVEIVNGFSIRLLIVAGVVSGIFAQVLFILVLIKISQDRKNFDNRVKEHFNSEKINDGKETSDKTSKKEEKTSSANYCNKCGNKVSNEDVFCKNCGNKLK